MSSIDIAVERPLLFLILIPALLLGIIPFLRVSKRRRASIKHLVPFVIHLCLIFLLSGMLGGITVTEVTDEKLETKVVFVADVSDSNIYMKDEMNDFIKEVIKASDKEKTRFGLVLFSNNIVETVDEDEFKTSTRDFLKFDEKAQKTDQTNIEQAIKIASELFGDKESVEYEKLHKKIIVLSDGLETVGDGLAASNQIDKGVQISGKHFSMVAEGTENKEVQLVSISTNNKVAEGGEVTVEVVIESTRLVRNATIKLVDGDITKTLDTKLQAGTNVFKLTYTPEVAGVNTIKAVVEVNDHGGDLLDGNNTLYAWYSLDAQKTVLIVDGDYGKENGQFDQIRGSQVIANLSDYAIRGPVSPQNFPKNLEEMLEYDQIVLMDVNFADLPENAGANLKRYVEEVGRGLFVSFGDSFYDIGKDNEFVYKDSPIAEILPVELKLEEERETVAMVLVVDLSSSMRQNMGNTSRFQTVLDSVKQVIMLGATDEQKENNEGFSDTDYLGVVCFDQDSHVALDLQQLGDLENREQVWEAVEYNLKHYYYYYYLNADGTESDIPVKSTDKSVPSGLTRPTMVRGDSTPTDNQNSTYIKCYGTSYKWAIQAASDMLARKNNETPLHIKQVLFMSDGSPNDQGSGYEGIVERMAKTGTVTSTISIGADSSAQQTELKKIAEAGKGTYVKVDTASDLTSEIVEKAEEVTPELVNVRDVLPHQLSLNSSVLQGVRDYEIIGGYYSSVIKPEADLVLYVTDYLKPLYAEWEYGLGKVSVYMSDLGNAAWTGALFDDNNGVNLVTNMFDATMNRQVDSTGLDYSATRDEAVTTVVVNTPKDVRKGEHLIAQVMNKEGKVVNTVNFAKTAIKKYKANIPTSKTDETYIIQLILVDDATGKMNDTTTFAVTGYYNSEYDVFNVSEGKANLAGIFNNTKGTMIGDDGVGGLFNETDSEIQIFKYDIDTPIAILALILFVLDIIFRNIVVIKKKDQNQMTEEERMASMRGR